MLYRFLFLTLAFVTLGYSGQSPLLNRLKKAQNGDFVVWETNKMITLLVIRFPTERSIIFEEISAPKFNNKALGWGEWLQQGAPGHTSWAMIEIDLTQKEILEAYSFSRRGWLSTSSQECLLSTLLHLDMQPLPDEKWRRIGPPPLEGEKDLRKIWNPPLFVEGVRIKNAPFEAFETTWPEDHSELAGKTLHVYFDQKVLCPLPTWIQIETGQFSASLRAIDAGHYLPLSIYRTIPKRAPEFIGSPMKTKAGGLRFLIKTPKYYKEFELYAVDARGEKKTIHLLNHSLLARCEEEVQLEVSREELASELNPNHSYTWLLIPSVNNSLFAELNKPFLWIP